MSKKAGIPEDFRVIVEPRRMTDYGGVSCSPRLVYGDDMSRYARDMRRRCEEIAEEIRWHVDNVGGVYVEIPERWVCEHCGTDWTEDGANYNGGCCAADQDAYEAALNAEPQA